MKAAAKALLTGPACELFTFLAAHLEKAGCECRRAEALADAFSWLSRESFHLVLSDLQLAEGSVRDLIPVLQGSRACLFGFQAAEDGYRWLPVVDHGRECTKPAWLRSKEFVEVLNELLIEAALGAPLPRPAAALVPHRDHGAVTEAERQVAAKTAS